MTKPEWVTFVLSQEDSKSKKKKKNLKLKNFQKIN